MLDAVGRVAKTAVQIALASYDPTTGLGAAWKALLVALMTPQTKVTGQSTSQTFDIGNIAISGPRCLREDKVTMDIADVNGQVHTFRIPTPSPSLGLVEGSDKIDPNSTLSAAWAAAMVAHACTADGVAFAGGCLGGRYIKHKREKKGGY